MLVFCMLAGSSNITHMSTTDWLGFIGISLILIAYFLNVIGKLENKNLIFILLNLGGAGMACLAAILLKFLPFVILEGAWAIVSLVALLKYIRMLRLSGKSNAFEK